MIFGIGTDIVSVERMRENFEKHGDKFARRILTTPEMEDFSQSKRPEHFLAKRFAAKEAAAKALGTGFSDGLSLGHIGVNHDDKGKPLLEFSGKARELIELFGISVSHISIADEQDHAVAFVTLES
ncbi:MAG: holo-ACP synthase [Gammaproteobacteria bacterium]|nr:holo-ACP synthase [Gammaproteobacteria bacterium]